MTNLEIFLSISRTLTGHDHLDAGLAKVYLKELEAMNPKGVADLISIVKKNKSTLKDEKVFEKLIWKSTAVQPLCQSIIEAWYTGSLSQNGATAWVGPIQGQYDGLLWRVVRAHTPGLSGGYFGYWRYKPEN